MKKENDIRVSMYRVKGDAAPFVLVDYMDKDAQEHTGVMMKIEPAFSLFMTSAISIARKPAVLMITK